ncbi:MAG: hypothetical protein RBR87_13495 [Bacteroidales bacterium]|jgi:YD repeat-containing protein|nr:hypothetical protein [Bacteroidales bacterium]
MNFILSKHSILCLLFALLIADITAQEDAIRIFRNESVLSKVDEKNLIDLHLEQLQYLYEHPDSLSQIIEIPEKTRARLVEMNNKIQDSMANIKSGSPSSGSNSFLTIQTDITVNPSPGSLSLINSINAGLDKYTGKTKVELPLFDFKSGDIHLPIRLNYSSSGVKVNEVPGWVGLGWSLNAGGAITRIIQGLPDEFQGSFYTVDQIPIPAFGYLNIKDKVTLENYLSYSDNEKKRIVRCASYASYSWNNSEHGYGSDSNPQAWDTKPDEFYFSFGEYSGKFVFDQDGNIHTIPHQNFHIAKTMVNTVENGVTYPKIVKFTVTTDKGFTYIFGNDNFAGVEESKYEHTRMNNNYFYRFLGTLEPPFQGIKAYSRIPRLNVKLLGTGTRFDTYDYPGNTILSRTPQYPTTWHLKEIISPSNDHVSFTYDDVEEYTYTQDKSFASKMPNLSEDILGSNGISFWAFISPEDPVYAPGTDFMRHPELQSFTYNIYETTVKAKKLNNIAADNGNKVLFIADELRKDLSGEHVLERIELLHGYNKVKQYSFEYVYYRCDNEEDTILLDRFENDPEHQIRLYLDQSFVNQKYQILVSNGSTIDPEEFGQKYSEIISSEHFRLYLTKVVEEAENGTITHFNGTYNQTDWLPRRFSYKQDAWGYFNNNDRGTLIPRISYNCALFGYSVPNEFAPQFLFSWDTENADDWSWKGGVRSPNLAKSKVGILEAYTSSLGGRLTYGYELNTRGVINVGGLRVNTITQTDENTTHLTSYTYEGGESVNQARFRFEIGRRTESVAPKDVFASSHSFNGLSLTHGGSVGYRIVKEFKSEAGKDISTFINTSQAADEPSPIYFNYSLSPAFNMFPFPKSLDLDWKRGLLDENRLTLDNEDLIIRKIDYNYEENPTGFSKNTVYGLLPAIHYLKSPVGNFENYLAGIYKFESSWIGKSNIHMVEYSSSHPGEASISINQNTEFKYEFKESGNNSFVKLQQVKTSNSNNEIMTVDYYSPLDYPNSYSAVINQMQNKLMLNYPIETITRINGQVTDAIFNKYGFFGQIIKPAEVHRIEINTPLNNFTPSNQLTNGQIDNRYKMQAGLDYLSNFGNLAEIKPTSNNEVAYIWDYNQNLLIAKIENATYDLVVSELTALGHTIEDLQDESDTNLRLIFNELRDRPAMKDAMITSYTHEPLVGMTSQTDPTGWVTYYMYDSFGRLQYIRNHEGFYLKEYEYHYGADKQTDKTDLR